MSIQLLPPQLANQIAAGEVVERPASVVKELLENSIDAGATKIEIEVTSGGHKQILIRDNGSGICKAELELALSRHATSKIKSLDDLEAITSMGFRGEALASISSVSRLTLTSRPADQAEAWQAHAEGRDMAVNIQPAAHPVGTSIQVSDLFFNTPARRRFLRTEKTEFGHIEAVFTRIALANRHIEFLLTHNGKRVKHLKVVSTLKQRLLALVSYLKTQTLWEINQQCPEISIYGLVVEPGGESSHQDLQFSFVNGRPMRDKLINHAIKQAFEQAGITNEQPQFVLFVTVEPDSVDVNVHPAKHEVRFHQARLVHDFIASSLRKLLTDHFSQFNDNWVPQVNDNQPSHQYIAPIRSTNTSATTAKQSNSGFRNHSNKPSAQMVSHYEQLVTPNATAEHNIELLTINPRYALLRHASDSDFYYIDWLLFTRPRLASELASISVSQPLLMPVAIPALKSWSERVRQQLELIHFHVDKAANKLILKQVPAGWRSMSWSLIFPHIIEQFDSAETTVIDCICEYGLSESPVYIEQTKQWFLSQTEPSQSALLQQMGSAIEPAKMLRLLKDAM